VRYRRYYTRRNDDGSRTVVSVGPIAMWYVWAGRFALIAILLGWPFAIPNIWVKILAACVWYPILLLVIFAYAQERGHDVRKVAVVCALIAGLILVSQIYKLHVEAQAKAEGCISFDNLPANYVDPSNGNNNCPDGYTPGPNWKHPKSTTPPIPSLAAQERVCRGHDGPEEGPDFPPPLYIGEYSVYSVSCMDGTDQEIHVR
jgi:hypothetical protein